jgi:hypothetical protein
VATSDRINPIRPVPQAQVDITDEFWAASSKPIRTVSIQHVFDRSEERGGRAPAQLIEAAGDMLSKRPDPPGSKSASTI